MDVLLPLALTVAAVAAALTRFTRLHPLLAALLVALPVAALGAVAAAGLMSTAVWGAALLALLIAAGPAALGAFGGWLLRHHRERQA